MDLEKLVKELNDTDLQLKDIYKITELINKDDKEYNYGKYLLNVDTNEKITKKGKFFRDSFLKKI